MYAAASLTVTRASKSFERTGRVVLICRVVSLWSLTSFIATHLGPELVEGHGAQHRYSLAEHLERHPDRTLAALASDPKDNPRPQPGKWCGCLPLANHRVSKTPDGFIHASCIFVGSVHSAMIGRRASLGRVSRGLDHVHNPFGN